MIESRKRRIRAVTDGEFRRSYAFFDYLEQLCGSEAYRTRTGYSFKVAFESPRKGMRTQEARLS